MLINKKKFIGLPVFTQGGDELGVVCDFEIDTEQHTVTGYNIKKSKLLPDFISEELLVRPTQVINISADKMVVDDLAIKEMEPGIATQPTT